MGVVVIGGCSWLIGVLPDVRPLVGIVSEI